MNKHLFKDEELPLGFQGYYVIYRSVPDIVEYGKAELPGPEPTPTTHAEENQIIYKADAMLNVQHEYVTEHTFNDGIGVITFKGGVFTDEDVYQSCIADGLPIVSDKQPWEEGYVNPLESVQYFQVPGMTKDNIRTYIFNGHNPYVPVIIQNEFDTIWDEDAQAAKINHDNNGYKVFYMGPKTVNYDGSWERRVLPDNSDMVEEMWGYWGGKQGYVELQVPKTTVLDGHSLPHRINADAINIDGYAPIPTIFNWYDPVGVRSVWGSQNLGNLVRKFYEVKEKGWSNVDDSAFGNRNDILPIITMHDTIPELTGYTLEDSYKIGIYGYYAHILRHDDGDITEFPNLWPIRENQEIQYIVLPDTLTGAKDIDLYHDAQTNWQFVYVPGNDLNIRSIGDAWVQSNITDIYFNGNVAGFHKDAFSSIYEQLSLWMPNIDHVPYIFVGDGDSKQQTGQPLEKQCTVHVPSNLVEAFQSHSGWSNCEIQAM